MNINKNVFENKNNITELYRQINYYLLQKQ